VPGATTAKVIGAFDDTRVIFGPTGEVTRAGTVPVTTNDAQAQVFSLSPAASATGVDLLIAATPPGVQLGVDLRADFDGKPDSASLLGKRVELTVPSRPDKQPTWVNVPFPAEFHFNDPAKYWLVLQSLQGEAAWSVQPAVLGKPVMQHTQDGGLSWRETPAPSAASPPSAFFRLRHTPAAFQVPVDLQIGTGDQAQRVKLDRFQPLGRVDFDLAIPEVAAGFNAHLAKAAPAACVEAEHLANGSFDQWMVVGNDPGQSQTIPAMPFSTVGAIAVSGDGKTAYVGGQTGSNGNSQTQIVLVDVACNRVLPQSIDLSSALLPISILLYPDGSKALVLTESQDTRVLLLVDLTKFMVLGSMPQPGLVGMAFSRDGSRLIMVTNVGGGSTNSITISNLATADFEQAFAKRPSLTALPTPQVNVSSGTAISVAGDQNRLYLLVRDLGLKNSVLFVDLQTGQPDGQSAAVGSRPIAMAITPDGSQIIVADSESDSLTFIDTQTRATTPLLLFDKREPLSPVALAVSPDGQRVFVAGGTSNVVLCIDLLRKSVIDTISVATELTSLAITPQGDQLYAAGDSLSYIPLGVRTPADWFLTSGTIRLTCAPQLSTAHIVAVLGNIDGNVDVARQASAISQVAPISAGCAFEFTFQGLSNDAQAVAEILWRGPSCQSLRTDSVPIAQVDLPAQNERTEGPAQSSILDKPLVQSRLRVTPPAGATAAEVRFRVPEKVAVVAMPSLISTSEAMLNGDLQIQQGGVPNLWTLVPATAQSFLVVPKSAANNQEVQLRNNGPNTAELVQSVPVDSGKDFTLAFTGRALVVTSNSNPKIELHWLKDDGSETGTAISKDIIPDSFNSRSLAGKVPDGASKAELHLSLPSGTALAVGGVSLRIPKATSMAVSFVAQSPGELRISGAQVAFDTVKPMPPPVPATGLCSPTPPDPLPGQPSNSGCFCSCCQDQGEMRNAVPATTPTGRPMIVGECATCGNQVVQGGGQPALTAQTLTIRTVPRPALITQPVLVRSTVPVAPPASLVDVQGIGQARAQQLAKAGIKTVEDLAKATSTAVAEALPSVSENNANILIRHAQETLAQNKSV
jgi:DNA-binding beta-propeller fold protein YncE